MLKNIIILVIIIIGGYMVYTNYMQNKEIAALDGVVNEEHPGKLNPEDVVTNWYYLHCLKKSEANQAIDATEEVVEDAVDDM